MAPAYSRNPLTISLLTGVKDAQLEGDEITGHWADELRPVGSGPSSKTAILEQFLNWASDPESILRFVVRYGPLSKPHVGKEFRQSLQKWRERQFELRGQWQMGASLRATVGLREGEMLHVWPNKVELGVSDLGRFLEFEIFSHPGVRRRVCERPDCPNPYFIATHLKTTLCSEVCKAWKQRQHQLKWWHERGDKWRKSRKSRGPSKVGKKPRGPRRNVGRSQKRRQK